jgi:hypothetical protein
MGEAKLSVQALAASLVLAAITLFVFYTLQDYGPSSAVRHFHRAVEAENTSLLQQVTVQEVGAWPVRQLVQMTSPLIRNTRHQVVRTDQQRDQAQVAVNYLFPDGRAAWMIWIVQKGPGRRDPWRVDAERTLTVFRDLVSP